MDRMQEQNQRIRQWYDAKNALLEFCMEVKNVTTLEAVYYLKGFTQGVMRIDDVFLAINEVKRAGFTFMD